MAFTYPHHIPQLPFYEELFEPATISRRTTLAAQKDDSDKPSVFMPDPSWAPNSRSYDPAGLCLTLLPHRPANAEQEDQQHDGSPLLFFDPNPAQYSDLNLNQNLKGSNIFPIQSNSKSYNNKKIGLHQQ
uniref:Uncharacterized protein n=1 Tax=Panagrolaimus davidi TaxID=227884 RepID=A0A914QP47_9BILA